VVLSDQNILECAGLVLAAGSGERLNGESKAFLTWRQEPLLLHVARTMARSCALLYIGIRSEEYQRADRALAAARLPVPYRLVTGGATRRETLRELLAAVDQTWVILHDVARPFAKAELFAAVLAAASEHGAATAAARLKDRDGVAEHTSGFIERTLPYTRLTYMQTPQACRASFLREALNDPALQEEHSVCGLLRARGHAVSLVTGDSDNVKITYPEDLQLLRWHLL
jgi:2-C-methyl-D-erythritol 4-phosphate cytidylyltransferase